MTFRTETCGEELKKIFEFFKNEEPKIKHDNERITVILKKKGGEVRYVYSPFHRNISMSFYPHTVDICYSGSVSRIPAIMAFMKKLSENSVMEKSSQYL